MEPREGSAPQLVDRQRHPARPGARPGAAAQPARSGPRCRCPGCASAWSRPSGGWPRPSGATSPTSTSTTTCAGRRCPAPARCDSCSTSPPRSWAPRSTARARSGSSSSSRASRTAAAAMIQKLHHAIADGEGSIRMSEQFIDIARDATEPIAPDRPVPEPIDTSLVETTVDTLTHQLRRGLGIVRRTAEGGLGLAPRPEPDRRARRRARRARAVRHAPGGRVGPGALTRCGRERSLRRRIEVLQVPMERGQGGRQGARREPQRLLRGRRGRRRRRLPPQGRASRSRSCASRCR